MLEHNRASDHAVVIETRELDIWCFACDRHLGEGESFMLCLGCHQAVLASNLMFVPTRC